MRSPATTCTVTLTFGVPALSSLSGGARLSPARDKACSSNQITEPARDDATTIIELVILTSLSESVRPEHTNPTGGWRGAATATSTAVRLHLSLSLKDTAHLPEQ